jgi:hypothetical protein
MPTPAQLKDLIDQQITDKTAPYSIDNIEVGERLKDIIDLLAIPVLQQPLTVNVGPGGSVGGSETNETFVVNTPLEDVLRDILIKVLPVSYVQPSLLLTETANGGVLSYEVGSLLNLTFSLAYTQNDAGTEVSRKLLKNNVQIATTTPHTDLSVTIIDTPIPYKGQLTYNQGACKLNNLGVIDCTGRVNAGTIDSNTITFLGFRKAFYGGNATIPNDSTTMRSLAGNSNNPQVGSSFIINIPIGSTHVVFAYPATLQDVSSVKYVELSNSEIKTLFTKSIVNVAGNNNYSAIAYKMFVYTPVQPFQTNATYVVTI